MIDLHAYVAGGMRPVEYMELHSAESVERSAGMCLGIQTEMYLGSNLGQYTDSCLYILHLILQDVVIVRSQRSGVESGDVECLGAYFRIGDDTVGTLLDAGPQSALEEGADHLLRSDGLGLGKIKPGVLRFRISLDSDLEKLSLLTSDNSADSSAHRRGESDFRSLLIEEKDGSGLYGVTFLYCELWNKASEIGGLYSHCLRNYTLEDTGFRHTLYRYVQPLFQFYIVNHILLCKTKI